MNAIVTIPDASGFQVSNPAALQQIAARSTAAGDLARDIGSFASNKVKLYPGQMQLLQDGNAVTPPATAMDLVILRVSPHLERAFYYGAYNPSQEATSPDCYSRDGEHPTGPMDKRPQVQETVNGQPVVRHVCSCAECPKNAKGSAPNGGRACSMFKRAAVVRADDINGTVYSLKIGARSIFEKGDGVNLSFSEYATRLGTKTQQLPNGCPSSLVVTTVAMKVDSVAVCRFAPKSFIDNTLWDAAIAREEDPEVLNIISGRDEAPAAEAVQALLAPTSAPAPAAPLSSPVTAPVQPTPAVLSAGQRVAVALQNPAVPQNVREWAAQVPPEQVLLWLEQNMPQVLVIQAAPAPVAPVAPAPVVAIPAPAPVAAPAVAPPQVAPAPAAVSLAPAPLMQPPVAPVMPPPVPVQQAAPTPYAQVPAQPTVAPVVMHQGQPAAGVDMAALDAMTASFDN